MFVWQKLVQDEVLQKKKIYDKLGLEISVVETLVQKNL